MPESGFIRKAYLRLSFYDLEFSLKVFRVLHYSSLLIKMNQTAYPNGLEVAVVVLGECDQSAWKTALKKLRPRCPKGSWGVLDLPILLLIFRDGSAWGSYLELTHRGNQAKASSHWPLRWYSSCIYLL